ncbi:hypothetical protein EXQ18_09635 [Salmonella enterica subsp. enterica]|nr:hypothetical protein [Salmonella enterica subsp. enterica]
MTTNPVVFSFESHGIRTISINGEPWFIAEDVCSTLNLTNPSMSLKSLDEDERSKFNLGRQGEANIINESGLYTLILRCRDAVKQGTLPWRFRKWVTGEVLPAIRKTGNYSQKPARRTDELNGRDMTNIKHLIHMMTNHTQHKESWNHAVWFCLRKATGVPSPQPFSVSDLPALADECRRIMLITSIMQNFMHTVEATMIKRVVRDGESAEVFIEEMHASFVELLRNETTARQKLAAFEDKALNDLRLRLN